MKIIYIVNARIPTEKAHGYQICKMCEEFSRAGAEVELWVPSRKNKINKNAFEYYNLEKNFKIRYINCIDLLPYNKYFLNKSIYIVAIWFFARLLLISIDKGAIVYTRNPEIVWWGALKKRKAIFDAHSWPNSKTKIFKYFVKKAEKIVCNSKGTEHKYNKEGFKNTMSAPNGVDLKRFEINRTKEELRQEFGLPINKKLAMYAGHLYKWKGIDVIMEAAEILKNDKNILFVAVGGTEKDVLKYRSIKKQKNLENIVFLGHRPQGEIYKYLKTADVLLLPNIPVSKESEEYTSPIKMFEYMASERSIIASELPSIKTVLSNENAFFIRPGDAKDLARQVNYAVNEQEETREKASKAYKKVGQYAWNKRAENILKFIK